MGARYGQRDGHSMDRETSKHQAWVNGEMVLLQREGREDTSTERSSTSLWRCRDRWGKKPHNDTGMAHPQTQALPPASWMLLLNSITPGDGITLYFSLINRL